MQITANKDDCFFRIIWRAQHKNGLERGPEVYDEGEQFHVRVCTTSPRDPLLRYKFNRHHERYAFWIVRGKYSLFWNCRKASGTRNLLNIIRQTVVVVCHFVFPSTRGRVEVWPRQNVRRKNVYNYRK